MQYNVKRSQKKKQDLKWSNYIKKKLVVCVICSRLLFYGAVDFLYFLKARAIFSGTEKKWNLTL